MVKTNGIICIAMALIVLIAFAVTPSMACTPGTPCSKTLDNGKITLSDPVVLMGADNDIAARTAMENKKVKELQTTLENQGYVQDDVKSSIMYATMEDGSVTEIRITMITYQSLNGTMQQINYVQNVETGETIVAMGSIWDCAQCLAYMLLGGMGCAAVCVTLGELTFGALCIGCIAFAASKALCPCYKCCDYTTGDATCHNMVVTYC